MNTLILFSSPHGGFDDHPADRLHDHKGDIGYHIGKEKSGISVLRYDKAKNDAGNHKGKQLNLAADFRTKRHGYGPMDGKTDQAEKVAYEIGPFSGHSGFDQRSKTIHLAKNNRAGDQ